MEAGLPKDHSPSPPQNPNPNHKERQPTTDQSVSNGEHGRPQQHSPQQQHAFPPPQHPPNSQQFSGLGVGQQQHHGPAGQSLQSSPPRPYTVPGSPAQRPLGVEIRAPGPTSGAPSRPPPPPPAIQRQQQHQQQAELPRQPLLPEVKEFKEPDEPLSDMDDTTFEEDDIEGGGKPPAPLKGSAVQPTADRPPPRASVAGGPPAGPPRGPARKLSSSAGSGPARIIPPSNDPTSPPASAFPTATQPRSRVRPPPGNKEFTPYRPPERPSQAPVMYSQTGQPTISQPLSQDSNSLKGQSPAATSMVPQGAEATSSSIRPREGGLQKRVFAGENNASKPVGGTGPKATPPSPKLHGQKGPAILSTSGQRSSSSTVKTLKTWAIRGGLIYLGYTAVFNCGPEATGARGFYCKATNGLGGLVKPLVAPHYNAYLGPHVDRYVKPAAKQSHRIYLKVADPVVQGALSAAGTVYKSTAKKHVDSAKDQMVSILPYPFKSKSGAAKGADQVPKAQDESRQEDHLNVGRVSRQPVHVEEPVKPAEPAEKAQQIADNIESAVDTAKETVAKNPEEVVHTVQEVIAGVKETVVEHATTVVEAAHLQEEKAEAPSVEVKEQSPLQKPETEQQPADLTGEGNERAHETEQNSNSPEGTDRDHMESKHLEDNIVDKVAAFKDSMKNVHGETHEGANDDRQDSVKADETKVEELPHVDAAHEPSPEIATSIVPESEPISTSHQKSVPPHSKPQELPIELHSTETAESTPEFLDQPTAPSSEVAAEVTPHPVVSSSEDVLLKGGADNVELATPIEEEHREHIPIATDEPNGQAPKHVQQAAEDVRIENEQVEETHGHEREHHKQEEPVPEEEAEHNVTLEQQAAPVLEVEHDSTSKAHDEL
ncbi:hypothetical protein BGZ58_004203 [Dissophora ornata]|nr:hypothetical protein BGZ58_004203 [Dissophora ornata]